MARSQLDIDRSISGSDISGREVRPEDITVLEAKLLSQLGLSNFDDLTSTLEINVMCQDGKIPEVFVILNQIFPENGGELETSNKGSGWTVKIGPKGFRDSDFRYVFLETLLRCVPVEDIDFGSAEEEGGAGAGPDSHIRPVASDSAVAVHRIINIG